MKILKKIVISLIGIGIILTLAACSVNIKTLFTNKGLVTPQPAVYQETMSARAIADYGFANATAKSMTMGVANDAISEEAANGTSSDERKIIRTFNLTTETKTFDESINWLRSHIDSYKGIIDSSYVDSGNKTDTNYRKNAYFQVRIPADKADGFLKQVGTKLNVTFQEENIQDVTDNYGDIEAKKKTLSLEVFKLNELLTKTKNVDELLKIESKLSEVNAEIQKLAKRLANYDRKIDYSTININISEVKDLTEVIPTEDYSKENLLRMLNNNLLKTKKFIVSVGVFLFTHIPQILLILAIILIIIGVICLISALSKPKKEKGTKKVAEVATNDKKKKSRKKPSKKAIVLSPEKQKTEAKNENNLEKAE